MIYDVLYGFVPITQWEEEILNSPYFQRLRWIKQLSFSNYIFPGAEHNRFGHSIGVLHSMDQMIRSLGLAVPDGELFSAKARSPRAMLHKSLRLAALLHDLGTFPFSHAIEYAYMRHGNDGRRATKRMAKILPNSHEHLGSFIIKNTSGKNGLTTVLDRYGFDVQLISRIIKGECSNPIANQLVHSDLDADRMDYLLRDSHYTGLKYGQFDRDYILANLTTYDLGGGQKGFGIRENAAQTVEDFLIARFNWYSQVIRNPASAKFDAISTSIASAFLREDLIHQFHDLLDMVSSEDERFFWWNDVYFLTRCQEARYHGLVKDPVIQEQIEMLLFRRPPKTLRHELTEHRILPLWKDAAERAKCVRQIENLVEEFKDVFKRHGTGKEWIVADLPERDIVFTKSVRTQKGSKQRGMPRDPVKVIGNNGQVQLLSERKNGLLQHLGKFLHFVPSLYGNEAAYALLRSKKLIR